MAMIGAFLGWQATVIVFFIAPVLALLLGPLARRVSKEVAVPYGPFLALGAIITMFTWRWIWMFEVDISAVGPDSIDDRTTAFAVRRMFGDWMLLTGLSAVALIGTVGLMTLIRLFWSMPIQRVAGGPDLEIGQPPVDALPTSVPGVSDEAGPPPAS
jgi:leader peptidase (prepilin peptidase)/N-methyltransferase